MTGFSVVPGSVMALGHMVGRAGEAAEVYAKVLDRKTTSARGDGVFGLISDQLTALRLCAQQNTRRARDLANASATELARTSLYYSSIDTASAERFDRGLPEVAAEKYDEWGLPGAIGQHSFADIADASDPHGKGGPYQGPEGADFEDVLRRDQWPVDFKKKLDEFTELTSKAGMVGSLLQLLIGRDPVEEAAKWLAGDWQAIYVESVVLADSAKGFELVAKNLRRGRFAIQDDWEGNAASAAENWLDAYVRSCQAHAEFLEDAARKVEMLAKAAYHRFESLNIAIGTVLDAATDVIATRRAGAIGGGLVDLAQGRVDELLRALYGLAGKLAAIVDMFWAFAHEYCALLAVAMGQGQVAAAKWPQAAIDHPEV